MATYLFDTNIIIRVLNGTTISPAGLSILVDATNDFLFSVASLWEMQIKVTLSKLQLALPIADIARELARQRVQDQRLGVKHIVRLEQLPPHHGDPFDCLLVAQAIEREVRLLSTDQKLSTYPNTLIV
ncbi:type II toxin-antitoxin system VapC family toxin [Lichenicoccus sp.]|uniref:type II toxin-antitoxin system VapC family toxin n=1 Tax=Lichenicoccus sp. TaxID=2781899 RepID=UPI003D0D31F3